MARIITSNGADIGGTESIIKADGLKHSDLICEKTTVAENGQQNSTGNINSTTKTIHSTITSTPHKTITTKPLSIISTFCGAGGIDVSFLQAGFTICYANEFDPYPAIVYNRNFKVPADVGDIRNVDPNHLPKADGIVGGLHVRRSLLRV